MKQNGPEHATLGVTMVEPEIVKQIRVLSALGWGRKRIARTLGVAPNSVWRYLRGGDGALIQSRPGARRLSDEKQARARALLDGAAEGNTVVVRRLLASDGIDVSLRTLQRTLAPHRRA